MQSYATSGTQQFTTIPQGTQTSSEAPEERVFPVRTFKVLGGIQIGLGTLVGLLCIIAIILDAIYMRDDGICSNTFYYDDFARHFCYHIRGYAHVAFAFDVSCLVCSGWFILTGFLPMCMSRKRKSSWRCLKIAFMVCCIIGASIFIPTVFSLGVTGSILRTKYVNKSVVVSAFIAVLSFAELVVAILAASYCCCCTKWDNTPQQGYVFIGGSQPQILMVPQSQMNPGASMQPVVMSTGAYNQPQQFQIITSSSQNTNLTGNLQEMAIGGQGQDQNIPPPYKE